MDLVYRNVYGENGKATAVALALLYAHLAERPEEANISHMAMPPWEVHKDFVQSQPYAVWWLVYARVFTPPEFGGKSDGGILQEVCIGNAYVTRAREIGIAVDEGYRRQGVASEIIPKLIGMFQPRGPFFANVAPDNKPSHALFESQGFRLVQMTYRIDPVFFDEPLYPGHPATRLTGNPAIKLADEKTGAEAPEFKAGDVEADPAKGD
jgi:RimJ/RimL family protein N-acetyltransferase